MPVGEKRDRTARLVKVEQVLYAHPHGLKPTELARLCGVHKRTAYRDLHTLETELQVPLWQDEAGRYGLERSHFLPPVNLTLCEATALYIASRLACKYADEADPALSSAFSKLAAVLPKPIAQHVYDTVATLAAKAPNEPQARVFDILATAWAEGRRVRIWYHRPGAEEADNTSERLLDPYALEPSAIGHACYVVGFDHRSGEVRTFKAERIQAIELTAETFVVPDGWRAGEYFGAAWGVMHEEEVEVRARFSPAVAPRVREAIWHPSQALTAEPDGSLLFSVRVAGTLEVARWLLTWGEQIEVLEPASLRLYFAQVAQALAARYPVPFSPSELAPT